MVIERGISLNLFKYFILAVLLGLLLTAVTANKFSFSGLWETVLKPSPQRSPLRKIVNLQNRPNYQIIPQYIDLAVGDTLSVIKANGDKIDILIDSVEMESLFLSCPRTRVELKVGERSYAAYCGMLKPRRGGIGPVDIEGVRIGVEVTRLLFSKIKGGSSPFDTYANLRLQDDVRLAVWDGSGGIMHEVNGSFIVKQPSWSRDRFGNWLHETNYGIHSAIDIFATTHGVPEEVISPIDGTVYRVYNRDASSEDQTRSKAINIYGDAIVGPNGEKILYRFHHFSKILVADGDSVKRGQVIGLTGHTGFDPKIGDHVHLEIRLNPSHFGLAGDENIFATIPVNPYFYLLDWYKSTGAISQN